MDKLKERLRQIDWWETTYLIIYGVIFAHEFEYTTMFNVDWPPKIGYVFMAASALYTIAKFIWHNTYTKKEMILSVLIIIAFVVPAIVTDYSFIFWGGFLIVGAKDVDFKKILKVYLVISITFMVAAFSASQYGLIEDLQYVATRGEETFVRHSFGIVYPTDYAAHLFYMTLAVIVLFEDKMSTMAKVWLSLLVAGSVYLTSNAQTTMLCLVGFAGLCIFERIFRKYMCHIEKVLRWTPVVCAGVFFYLSYFYDTKKMWMLKLDMYLSNRLEISKKAFDLYKWNLFGQNIEEVGSGSAVLGWQADYFFLDDSYVRILVKYGMFLLGITFMMMLLLSRKASRVRRNIFTMALVAISIHSIMEHRLIDIAYNPLIPVLFAHIERRNEVTGG